MTEHIMNAKALIASSFGMDAFSLLPIYRETPLVGLGRSVKSAVTAETVEPQFPTESLKISFLNWIILFHTQLFKSGRCSTSPPRIFYRELADVFVLIRKYVLGQA